MSCGVTGCDWQLTRILTIEELKRISGGNRHIGAGIAGLYRSQVQNFCPAFFKRQAGMRRVGKSRGQLRRSFLNTKVLSRMSLSGTVQFIRSSIFFHF